jgi:hypothetical protein
MREAEGVATRQGTVAALVLELTSVLEAGGIEEAKREAPTFSRRCTMRRDSGPRCTSTRC